MVGNGAHNDDDVVVVDLKRADPHQNGTTTTTHTKKKETTKLEVKNGLSSYLSRFQRVRNRRERRKNLIHPFRSHMGNQRSAEMVNENRSKTTKTGIR